MKNLIAWTMSPWDTKHYYFALLFAAFVCIIISMIFRIFDRGYKATNTSLVALLCSVASFVVMIFFSSFTMTYLIVVILTFLCVLITLLVFLDNASHGMNCRDTILPAAASIMYSIIYLVLFFFLIMVNTP